MWTICVRWYRRWISSAFGHYWTCLPGFSAISDHFWHLLGPFYGSSLALFGPFGDRNRTKIGPFWGDFWVILDHFWVDPGSLWGHLGIILASFWHHFGVVLASFWPHFETYLGPFLPFFFWRFLGLLKPKTGHFGGFGVKNNVWKPLTPILKRTLRAIDWWRNQGKRTRIARGMTRSWRQKGYFT